MSRINRLAVIGDPIAHSLSPLLHNAMARELGLPYSYEARRVPSGGLPAWLDEVKTGGWSGFNATMPHKLHLIPLLDALTEQAVFFGAVNTVKNENGVLTGHNTDGDGFARMLAEHGLGFSGSHVVILGAGGAAGAIARKAVQDGAAHITICNRTLDKAERLCAVSPSTMSADILGGTIPNDTSLLVNTLPVGSQLDFDFINLLNSHCAVIDILYSPPQTPLLEAAASRGLFTLNGLGMLIHQAILAFAYFTGAAIDPGPMAKLLYREVNDKT